VFRRNSIGETDGQVTLGLLVDRVSTELTNILKVSPYCRKKYEKGRNKKKSQKSK